MKQYSRSCRKPAQKPTFAISAVCRKTTPYKQKIAHAENVARKLSGQMQRNGSELSRISWWLDFITLHYFLETCGGACSLCQLFFP